MASEYTVKRGDNLTKIVNAHWSYISGNTLNAKIDTLVSLNGIKNKNKIYVGQVLKLSGTASGGSSSASSTPPNNAVIQSFGLQSESESGRDLFASWTWHKLDPDKDNFENFKIRWEWDSPNPSNPEKYITRFQEAETTDTWAEFTIPEEFQKTANWAQIFITPIAKTKDNSTKRYWTADETNGRYNFSDNPPLVPDKPTCEIEDTTLTMKIDSIPTKLDASYIIFQVVKDNSSAVYTSDKIPIVPVVNDGNNSENGDYGKVSHTYAVELGSSYKVRAKSVGANGKESGWTEFSDEEGTKPSAPASITTVRKDTHLDEGNNIKSYSVFLEWTPVNNAEKYIVEYTTNSIDFESTALISNYKETVDKTPSIRISVTLEDMGFVYYFRVRTVSKDGESDPSDYVKLPISVATNAPKTWSTSDSAFVGETMELNWIHNPADNSKQTYAQLSFNINDEKNGDGEFVWNDLELMGNPTDASDEDDTPPVTKAYTYGVAVSYKGELYFQLDTSHQDFKNKKIQWRVRTVGIGNVNDGAWSLANTIYIYEKPTLELSVTYDLDGNGDIIETLTKFPFYVRGKLSLTDYTIQRPVGYHLQVVSNDYYTTVDDIGRTKVINPGDAVYSKYFNNSSNPLIVELSADNIDLESGIQYVIYCTADMSTGLAVGKENPHYFTVNWIDAEYAIDADISINNDAYTALITPYCREKIPTVVGEGDDAYITYEDGNLVENVTLSVYRREYDGSYTEIATGIPNNYTSVTDPHPALDFARYRFTAKDKNTGALSFWDMAGYPVNGKAVVIQWDEEWSTFDTGENTSVEGPSWSGSLLKLPYNIKISDKRKRDKTLVNYVGREHPVSYYGTQLNETSQWNVDIPASDKETIYALRRLSIWSGDVYVREPSGMGFWANVEVSFNKSYSDVKIPVTLSVTRVEGGV